MNPQEQRARMINDLNAAAENGDNDAIKRLADQITPPMATDEWQEAIRKAACSDHLDTLNVLMDECHADLGDQQHILELIISVVDNTSLDMMHFLMKQAMKASGQETDQDEAAFIRSLDAKVTDPLLCYATWNDSRQILSYLADILNITSLKDNQKLIEKAMVSCQPDIIKYLIEEQQVDVNATDEDGNSIVFHTVINNDLELLTYLIEQQHADITLKNNRGESLLHYAVCYSGADDKRIVRYLIETCHLDVNEPTDNGVTHLDLACNANSNLNLVRYLVESCGAKVRTGEHEGITQLHICACQHSPIEILEYFINEVGLDPQAVTHEGDTLLHCVCAGNATSHYLNLVKLLVETYHLDPNARKPNGLIPLHLAVTKSDQESILYLINQDPTTLSVCNDKGMTPFLTICGFQNLEFIRTIIHDYHVVLKPLSNLSENPVLCAAGNPDIRVIQALVKEYGLSPNVTDASGTNAISYAVITQNTDIIPILVNTLNLDPNAPNHAGITPLMLAIYKGNPDMVQTLIQVGADINLRDVNGDTPLIQAIDTENFDVVQKLIQAGADVSLCDADGKTAIMHVAANIPVTTLKILLLLAAAQTEVKVPCPPCPPQPEHV